VQDGEIVIHTFAGTAVLLTPETGLIGSPTPQNDGRVSAQSLLQPDLIPGRQVQIKSKHVQGMYVVETAQYEGETAGDAWFVNITARPL